MSLKNNKAAFDYSEYLRDYYNRMASGKERVPSNAELSLFYKKLARVIKDSQVNEEYVEMLEELPLKKIA